MTKFINILALIAVLGLFVIGCGNNPTQTESDFSSDVIPMNSQKVAIPAGATLESATLNIYIEEARGQTVNVYRITNPWQEYVVSWGSFAGAFHSDVWGSFVSDITGWKTVDVTGLVTSWMDGTHENFGLLLKQPVHLSAYNKYRCREYATSSPYLTITYSTGGITESFDDMAIADTYIFEAKLTSNYGTDPHARTGWVDIYEKQTLLMFETEMFRQMAEIGDFLWVDENMNGLQDEMRLAFQVPRSICMIAPISLFPLQ